MNRHLTTLSALAVATVVSAHGLFAQQESPPTAEELAKRAQKAQDAVLFQSDAPLTLTLSTDISWIRDKRSVEEEVEGTVTYVSDQGEEVTVPVQVRARGNFRRDKRNCNFPPLRLNFAGKEVKGTVFDGQDKVKLVTPCNHSRDSYQQYVLQEYLVYRTFQLLTPLSYRVRLVHITYEDPNGDYDTRTKTGFLIEADDQMAARHEATMVEAELFDPNLTDAAQSSLVALFQYMIGNTDFSAPYFHNAEMIRSNDEFFVIPYDFDWSGVVNARYAVPDPQLDIRNVTERVYRGFCQEGVDHSAVIALYNAQREAVVALYDAMDELEADQRKNAMKYYDNFYEIINDPGKFEREILRECREVKIKN